MACPFTTKGPPRVAAAIVVARMVLVFMVKLDGNQGTNKFLRLSVCRAGSGPGWDW